MTEADWTTDAARWPEAICELRSRFEALEGKYEPLRPATLEWGKDVDKVKHWSDQHLRRIEGLEAAVGIRSAPESSLVERVHSCIVGGPPVGHMQARAVLREVAEWLREQRSYVDSNTGLAQTLEQEAGDA